MPDKIIINEFELYRDPSTNQVPEIIINLIKPERYETGINQLVEILKTCRSSSKLILFKVRSLFYPASTTSKEELPSFFMRTSDLYIVGYKIADKQRIYEINSEEEDASGFPSLTYIEQTIYNVENINLLPEEKEESVRHNWHNLHALGYVVAEAVREKEIEIYISTKLMLEQYTINVLDRINAFAARERAFIYNANENVRLIEKVLNPALRDVATGWGKKELLHDVQDVSTAFGVIVGYIEHWDIFRLGTQEERREFAQKCLPFIKCFVDNSDSLYEAMEYDGPRIKPLSNKTELAITISAGLYQEDLSNPGHYSKISDSEMLNLNYYNNYRPDDDKGGEGVIKNEPKSKKQGYSDFYFKISAYLSWVQKLPEWLQKEMLKSKVAQNIIDSLKQNLAIYQRKSVNEGFNIKLNQASLEENSNESEEENLSKAQISDRADVHDLIDMTIIIATSVMSIPFLPTIESIIPSIDTTSLLGKINPSVDFTNYNLLNVLEVSY